MLKIASRKKLHAAAPSKYLLIHCHGGGWTFQSSRARKCCCFVVLINLPNLYLFTFFLLILFKDGMYLREWAAKLDVPILSIDYSLAPDAPFPCAVEEVFYAYCWTLKNSNLLGTTGENIVFVGDSAGANLMISCITKCVEMGIKKPKAMFGIYAALMMDHVMAPSRFIGFAEVILPYHTYLRCFNAYNKRTVEQKVSRNRKIPKLPQNEFEQPFPKNYLMTPHLAPDEILSNFPTVKILSTNMDPCLDECVEFAKRLRSCEVNVQFEMLEGLNHGFLHFSRVKSLIYLINISIEVLFISQISKESHQGSMVCMQRLAELLELN